MSFTKTDSDNAPARSLTKNKQSSSKLLLRTLTTDRFFWKSTIVGLSLCAAIFGILGPYFQKHFVDQLLGYQESVQLGIFRGLSIELSLLLTFAMFICASAFGIFSQWVAIREGNIAQRILSDALYRKILSLRSDSLEGRPVGELVSLYAVDVPSSVTIVEQSLPTGAAILFPILIVPVALVFLFDMPVANVVFVMGFIVGINGILALRQAGYFVTYKNIAATRTGLVSEWIQNIRTLKTLGWIDAFERRIFDVREEETRHRRRMLNNGQLMSSLSSSLTFFINIAGLLTLVLTRPTRVSPGELMSLLWILGVFLNRPFRQMPWFFTFCFDGLTSVRRLNQVLKLENQGFNFKEDDFEESALPVKAGHFDLAIEDLTLRRDGQLLLRNVSVSIPTGQFVAIVGEVGSGKSLFLLSLLGETGADFKMYSIGGRSALTLNKSELAQFFSFVPQEGFVMSGSLRDNIVFEYGQSPKWDSKVYEAIQSVELAADFADSERPMELEFGERGVNLSGGQKQRVNIARARFYSNPIVLLDDCLSALDVETEEQLTNTLLLKEWRTRTRILATHRFSILKNVDRVLFFVDGQIRADGPFEDLIANDYKFQEFVESLNRKQKKGAEALHVGQ